MNYILIVACISVFVAIIAIILSVIAMNKENKNDELTEIPKVTKTNDYIDDLTPSLWDEKCIFSDTFKEAILNRTRWNVDSTYYGGGNNEFQAYLNVNDVFKMDSSNGLKIIPQRLSSLYPQIWGENSKLDYNTGILETTSLWNGNPDNDCTNNNYRAGFNSCSIPSKAAKDQLKYVSGAIRTHKSFSFLYGRVEVTAKLPKGNWLWPAIWLTSSHNNYGPWPMSPEIDIMESYGNDDINSLFTYGYKGFGSTLHWGRNQSENQWSKTHEDYHGSEDLSSKYKVYGLYWSKTELYTYIRDENSTSYIKVLNLQYGNKSMWDYRNPDKPSENPWSSVNNIGGSPFSIPMSLIINLAIGGFSYTDPVASYFSPYAYERNPDKSLNMSKMTETPYKAIKNNFSAKAFDTSWSKDYPETYWPGEDGMNEDGITVNTTPSEFKGGLIFKGSIKSTDNSTTINIQLRKNNSVYTLYLPDRNITTNVDFEGNILNYEGKSYILKVPVSINPYSGSKIVGLPEFCIKSVKVFANSDTTFQYLKEQYKTL